MTPSRLTSTARAGNTAQLANAPERARPDVSMVLSSLLIREIHESPAGIELRVIKPWAWKK
jgi:hypothetical protein